MKINEIRKNLNEQVDAQKKLFTEMRKKVSAMALGNNNVNRLMREKIDDFILVQELPLPIQIGNKTVWVGNFNLDNQHKFFQIWCNILANRSANIINFDLLANGADLYKAISVEKKLYKGLLKLIKKTVLNSQDQWQNLRAGNDNTLRLPKCTIGYFKKHVTAETLVQICMLIYIFNFDAEKKNLQVISSLVGQDQLTETYIYSWLRDSAGLTGKFLLSQLQNVDYWDDESMSKTVPIK